MIDIGKQITYWKENAIQDIDTADWLIQGKKIREGLFFCHLALEKILKALVVKHKKDIPPRTHDLFQLQKLSGVEINETDLDFLGILMKYQLEGRYPQSSPDKLSLKIAEKYYKQTKALMRWLINQL